MQQSSSSSSVLELIARQQTEGQGGVRIEVYPALVSPISKSLAPAHFLALHGQTAALVTQYARASAESEKATQKAAQSPACSKSCSCSEGASSSARTHCEKSLVVASVSANGVNGHTAWAKDLKITAEDVALLAGHPNTAKALHHIQSHVPLVWRRDNHHRYPQAFKDEVRTVVEALVQSHWFPALPGATRLAVTERVAQDMARHSVWGMLSDWEWTNAQRALQGLPELPPCESCGAEGSESVSQAGQQEGQEAAGQQGEGVHEEQQGEAHGDDDAGEQEGEGPGSPQLVIRLEPRFAFGDAGGRRNRLRLGRWGWLLRSVFPLAMWGLSLRVASKREALITIVAYLAGASCVL